jgi:prephenate dehydrogenase
MSPDAHDRTMAYVSHVPQIIAIAMMNAAADAVGAPGLAAAGPAFTEMTRVAASPAELWQGILAHNADFVAEALQAFVAALPAPADASRAEWVSAAFDRAHHARERWKPSSGPKP